MASLANSAQARQYRFEIIVFEYNKNQYTDSETWPTSPGEPDFGNSLSYIYGSSYRSGSAVNRRGYTFRQLKPGQLELKKEASAIKRSSSRKLLLHTGWIQNMHSEKKARPIAIKIGKEFTSLETGGINQFSQFQTPQSSSARHKQLEGTIKISISRYLHVWSDLIFRRPSAAGTSNDAAYSTVRAFRYQDHRRMRSKELHYIDNPSFGMLIYALPIKPAKKASE